MIGRLVDSFYAAPNTVIMHRRHKIQLSLVKANAINARKLAEDVKRIADEAQVKLNEAHEVYYTFESPAFPDHILGSCR